ncbi:trypsin-like serine peptidase [Micromonospora zhanjiangensis]
MKGSGVEAQQQALAAYWSPERMKSAHPDSELPSVKRAAAAAHPSAASGTATQGSQGPATSIPAAPPVTQPKATAGSDASTAGSDASTDSFYPNYPVGHPVARTNGKVFFTSLGLNYVCSGAIVNTEGKSTVWTAGHCVSDGGQWNTNWIFVPNYASGSAPYGSWSASALWTTSAWFYNNNDFANDVGAAIMYRNSAGYRITDYLGGQGIAWNYAVGQYAYAFGYPQASPYSGCCLVEATGTAPSGGTNIIYMANDMTGGASGGPWLISFDGNWGYINGHNDFKYTNQPQYMYSPYYGNQVSSLYNQVRNISS